MFTYVCTYFASEGEGGAMGGKTYTADPTVCVKLSVRQRAALTWQYQTQSSTEKM